MLKLKLQYFGHLMWRANSLEKTLMLGKIEGKRRRGQQRMRWLDSLTNTMDMNLSRLREIVEDRGAWCAVVRGVPKSQTQLSNWTTTTATNWEGAMADRMCQKCFVKFCAGDFLLDDAPQLCVFTHVIHVYNFLTIFFLYTKVPPKPKGLSL